MMRRTLNNYLAIAFLLVAQSTFAVDSASVITNTSTALDAGMSSLAGAKWLKARNYSSAAGNNALRKALANQANTALRSLKGMSEKYKLPLLSTAVQLSDTGATILGSLSEGDLSGAGSELVSTGVSTLTVTAGAAAGGKLFASAGALIGSTVPVVGTAAGAVIGGVVGSVGGAVLTSVGYDAYLKDWVKSSAEGAMTPPVDYVALAKQSREAFEQQQQENASRERSEDEKNQAANRFGYDKSTASSDASEVQLAQPKPDIVLPQSASSDPGKGIPLFPSNATISSISWIDSPDDQLKANQTYLLKEGAVLGQMTAGLDVQDCKIRLEGNYAGTIRDNAITGGWSIRITTHCTPSSNGCITSGYSTIESHEEVAFHLGGTLSGRVTGGSHNEKTTVSGCKEGKSYSSSGKVDPMPIRGTWKLAK